MKLDREFNFAELPRHVRDSLYEMVNGHVISLVHDYDQTLLEEGKYIATSDKELLVKKIAHASKITVKISAKCDDTVLENYSISPKDIFQQKLSSWEEAKSNRPQDDPITEDDKFSSEELASLESQDSAMYEKRKAAASVTEEAEE